MRAMWFGTRSSSRSLRPISITSPGTRQRHHPTVDMGYRTRYLQMAARMRARFSKTYSPGSWASSSSTWMRAMWFGTRSVSYTHLRAHETRHDLVCRLLLEKKKNYSHTRHYTHYRQQIYHYHEKNNTNQ